MDLQPLKLQRPPKTCEAPHWGRYEFPAVTFGEGLGGKAIIAAAPYAKGKVAVSTPSDTGYKTRAARLAEGVGGKWSNRCGAYIMSPAAAEKMHALYMNGMDYNVISRKFC